MRSDDADYMRPVDRLSQQSPMEPHPVEPGHRGQLAGLIRERPKFVNLLLHGFRICIDRHNDTRIGLHLDGVSTVAFTQTDSHFVRIWAMLGQGTKPHD